MFTGSSGQGQLYAPSRPHNQEGALWSALLCKSYTMSEDCSETVDCMKFVRQCSPDKEMLSCVGEDRLAYGTSLVVSQLSWLSSSPKLKCSFCATTGSRPRPAQQGRRLSVTLACAQRPPPALQMIVTVRQRHSYLKDMTCSALLQSPRSHCRDTLRFCTTKPTRGQPCATAQRKPLLAAIRGSGDKHSNLQERCISHTDNT